MWTDDIDLGVITETTEKGVTTEKITWTTLLANQIDDNRAEFYKAMQSGLKPEIAIQINDFEYNNEKYFRFPSGENGTVYTVIRAPKKGKYRELVGTTYERDLSG